MKNEHLAAAHRFGMIQNQVEVDLFLEWYEPLAVRRLMEIGTHTGGFLSLLIETGQPKELVVSVDLPWQAHEYQVGNFREAYADRVKFIVGNSHDGATLREVRSVVSGQSSVATDHGPRTTDSKLDFLFLDGDHSYAGVQQDFIMYSGLVRPGGWIGFHDINNGHACGKFYWDDAIKDRAHVEFGYGRTFGLGCVRV